MLVKVDERPPGLEDRPLQLGELLPLGERLGEGLTVEPLQLGLGVEGLELRWPARHAKVNHPFCPGWNVERLDHPRVSPGLRRRLLGRPLRGTIKLASASPPSP